MALPTVLVLQITWCYPMDKKILLCVGVALCGLATISCIILGIVNVVINKNDEFFYVFHTFISVASFVTGGIWLVTLILLTYFTSCSQRYTNCQEDYQQRRLLQSQNPNPNDTNNNNNNNNNGNSKEKDTIGGDDEEDGGASAALPVTPTSSAAEVIVVASSSSPPPPATTTPPTAR